MFVPSFHLGRSYGARGARVALGTRRKIARPKRSPAPWTLKIPYMFRISIGALIGLLILVGGTALSIMAYYPEFFSLRFAHNSSLPVGDTNRTYTTWYNSRQFSFVGPVCMGIGFFTIMVACVVYFEFRDRYYRMMPTETLKKLPDKDVYDLMVEQFRKKCFRGTQVPVVKPPANANTPGAMAVLAASAAATSVDNIVSHCAPYLLQRPKSAQPSLSEMDILSGHTNTKFSSMHELALSVHHLQASKFLRPEASTESCPEYLDFSPCKPGKDISVSTIQTDSTSASRSGALLTRPRRRDIPQRRKLLPGVQNPAFMSDEDLPRWFQTPEALRGEMDSIAGDIWTDRKFTDEHGVSRSQSDIGHPKLCDKSQSHDSSLCVPSRQRVPRTWPRKSRSDNGLEYSLDPNCEETMEVSDESECDSSVLHVLPSPNADDISIAQASLETDGSQSSVDKHDSSSLQTYEVDDGRSVSQLGHVSTSTNDNKSLDCDSDFVELESEHKPVSPAVGQLTLGHISVWSSHQDLTTPFEFQKPDVRHKDIPRRHSTQKERISEWSSNAMPPIDNGSPSSDERVIFKMQL